MAGRNPKLDPQEPDTADDKRRRFEGLVRRVWISRVVDAAGGRIPFQGDFWSLLARGFVRNAEWGLLEQAAERRGLMEGEQGTHLPDALGRIRTWIDSGRTPFELRGLIVELMISVISYSEEGTPPLESVAAIYDIPKPTMEVAMYLRALDTAKMTMAEQ